MEVARELDVEEKEEEEEGETTEEEVEGDSPEDSPASRHRHQISVVVVGVCCDEVVVEVVVDGRFWAWSARHLGHHRRMSNRVSLE